MNRIKTILFALLVILFASTNVFACQHLIKINKSDTSKKVNFIKQILVKNNQKNNRNVVLNNISQNSDPDFIISPFVEYQMETDSTLRKMNIPKEAKMVEFKITPYAYLKVSKHGKMVFSNETNLHLMTNSTYEISDSSILYIRNSSAIQIDSGAKLIVRGTGKIICEDNSWIKVHPYATIILQRKESAIRLLNGSKIITHEGLNVAYVGEGSVYIDDKEYYSIYGK